MNKTVIDSDVVFKLIDTHGIDFNLIAIMCKNENCVIDLDGFVMAIAKSKNYTIDSMRKKLYDQLDRENDFKMWISAIFV